MDEVAGLGRTELTVVVCMHGCRARFEAQRMVHAVRKAESVTRGRPREMKQIVARDAAVLIRKALGAHGTCSVAVGARRRTLALRGARC